jgi:hypothetical protein
VRAAFTPSARAAEVTVRELASYDPVDPDAADSQLLVRPSFLARGEPIARQRWHLKSHTVTLDSGF